MSSSGLTLTSASTTTLYIYYDSAQDNNTSYVGVPGSRTEVWDSDFAGVWHLSQDPTGGSGCIKDSTSNGNDGTPGGSMTSGDLVDGPVPGMKALDFDGADDYVNMGSVGVQTDDRYTVLASIYKHSCQIDNLGIIIGGGYGGDKDGLLIASDEYATDDNPRLLADTASQTFNKGMLDGVAASNGETIALNTWHRFAFDVTVDTHDGGDHYLAAFNNASNFYDGLVSNLFLYKGELSSAWAKADYYAQTDDLLSYGTAESCPAVSGTVEESGSPVARTVRVYDRSTGELIDETTSDSGDGSWSIAVGDTSPVYVVCLDDDSGTQYNAQIYDRVSVS